MRLRIQKASDIYHGYFECYESHGGRHLVTFQNFAVGPTPCEVEVLDLIPYLEIACRPKHVEEFQEIEPPHAEGAINHE